LTNLKDANSEQTPGFPKPPYKITKLGVLNLCANLNKAYMEVVLPHFPVSLFLFMQVPCN